MPITWLKSPLQGDSLRYLAHYLATQSVVIITLILLFEGLWQIDLPRRLLMLGAPLQLLLTLLVYRWADRRQNLASAHYLLLLLLSMLLLGWFLHDSGGHTNPLISLLLVPVAMAAVLLSWQASLLLSFAALSLYLGLMESFVPLTSQQPDGLDNLMQLHLIGMWLTFLLSVLLIIGLIAPMAAAVRRQREQIAEQREQMLRDERLIAMATFAASAAHQLGTPLSTLALLIDDMREGATTEQVQDLATMASQIALCKTTLNSLMRRSEDIRLGVRRVEPVAVLVLRLREQFGLLHPALSLTITGIEQPETPLLHDDTLDQAILNLLDNAARISQQNPSLEVRLQDNWLCLRILDQGPGIPETIRDQLGQPFVSGREGGTGLGLFLSHATINRFGGTLHLADTPEGTLSEIRLPRSLA